MKVEVATISFMLILLFSLTISSAEINQASATIPPWLLTNKNPIYIHANGSITPQTISIQKNGDTYTLTSNINNQPIIVERNNTIIDGAGYIIETNKKDIEEPIGLTLDQIQNITIKNLTINGFKNEYGSGIAVQIASSQNVLVENCNLTSNGRGISIRDSQNVKIAKNHIENLDKRGISIWSCNNVSVANNYISGNEDLKNTFYFMNIYGVHMGNSENIEISKNTISNTWYGIEIHTQGATIFRNYFTKNHIGIYICNAGENLLTENTVIDSESFGIRLSIGSIAPANIIYHNNFINNNLNNITELLQVSNPWFFGPESNTWDNGKEGNYWSDYTLRYPNVTRKDNPDIWLVDFFINPENIDHFPLVDPWISDTTPPLVTIHSLNNQIYGTTSIPINYSINEAIREIKYSLDGQEKVEIIENFTLTNLLEGEHNLTVYATDLYGNVGVSSFLYFTVEVPDPFPTTLAVISVVILAVVGIGLFTYFKKRRS